MIAKDSRIQDRLEHSHHAGDIARRLAEDPPVSYLRDWIYGGIDGTITTFAIVAGVVGADMPDAAVLVLGMANLVADGFAMGAGNYSGTKAESDLFKHLLEVERRHISLSPGGDAKRSAKSSPERASPARIWSASLTSLPQTKTAGRLP